MKRILACLAAVSSVLGHAADPDPDVKTGSPEGIIPVPMRIEMTEGVFTIQEDGASFHINGDASGSLTDYIGHYCPVFTVSDRQGDADILIEIGAKALKGTCLQENTGEAYSMEVSPERIKIKAGSEAGAFYAVQSLIQMIGCGNTGQLQCCRISDAPRFGYRGLHFDVSRHFRTKEFLMKQMDAMALVKLNRMHLHLTDGAGIRDSRNSPHGDRMRNGPTGRRIRSIASSHIRMPPEAITRRMTYVKSLHTRRRGISK